MRAASARVAAATSSNGASRTGTTTCTPFEPLVFTAPLSPESSSACWTSRAARTTVAKSAPSGGSRSSTRPVGSASPTRKNGTWNSTARWLASHSSVRRSSQSTWAISRCEPSDHTGDGAHPVRRALRHVALHERRLTGAHPLDRQRPAGEQRHEPVGDGVQVVDELALGHPEVVAQGLVEAGQPDAVPLLLATMRRPQIS